MRELARNIGIVGSAAAMLVAGCFVDAGLDDCDSYPGPGCPIGSGGTSTTTSSTATGSGAGGSGTECTPGKTVACYSGPSATLDKGTCKAGTQVCGEDGVGFGPCVGEVLPAPSDDCTTPLDENCDGVPNESCACEPGSTQTCYSGPAGTMGVGVCTGGIQTCNADGKGMSPCVGEVVPSPEDCSTGDDEDCDGKVFDDADDGCSCQPGNTMTCMTGLMGGCTTGTQTCSADGKSYGACAPVMVPTTEDCSTAGVDENCDGDASCNGGAIVGKAKGIGNKEDFAFGTAFDLSGNFIVGGIVDGSLSGTLAFDAGSLWLAKYTAAGALTWEKTFAPTGAQPYARVYGVATDAGGNIFAGGDFKGTLVIGGSTLMSDNGGSGVNAFLLKLDAGGNVVWAKSFGGTGAQVIRAVAVDDAGNVLFCGELAGSADFGGGVLTANATDAFVAKLDGTGGHIWSRRSGDSSFQAALDIAVAPGGDAVIVGAFAGQMSFGTTLGAGNDLDAFVIRLQGSTGAEVWGKSFGDGAYQYAYGVAVDAQSNVVITGAFESNINFGGAILSSAGGGTTDDVFVAKLAGASGAHLWSKGFGSGNDQVAYGVALDGLGNVVVAGSFENNINFGGGTLNNQSATADDVFVAKLRSSDGAHLWSKSFGDNNNNQFGFDVAVDGLGNVVVAGGFQGSVDFGGPVGALTSTGGYDVFAVKLKP